MRRTLLTSLLILAVTGTLLASEQQPELHVLVDGWLAPEHFHEGKIYIEALKGKEYAIRITNPLCTRIAVALAVDGLNTIMPTVLTRIRQRNGCYNLSKRLSSTAGR